MTVPSTPRRAGPFNGNAATTAFPFTFKVFDKTNIQVVKVSGAGVQSTLTLDSDYSVSVNADQTGSPGGTVTFPIAGSALAVGETLSIVGALPYSQTTTFPAGGNFPPSVVEATLDKLAMQDQQLLEQMGRTLQLPTGVDPATVSAQLPAPLANRLLGWNASAQALQNVDPTTLAPIQITTAAQISTADGGSVATSLTSKLHRVVDSIAALRLLVKTQYTRAFVTGYYAAGDGGGGSYYYDSSDTSSADNGGTIIVAADGGRWKLANVSMVTADQFGAKGDGVTDATAAIQAGLNAVGALRLRGKSYYIASGLTLPYGGNLVGEDGAQLIGPATGTAVMLTLSNVNNNTTKPYYKSHIRNITFQVRANYRALAIFNTSLPAETVEEGVIVEDCLFTSWGYTSAGTEYLVALYDVVNARFSRCTFQSYSASGINGINNGLALLGVANSTFVACNFSYLATAILLGKQAAQITQGVRFIGCVGNGTQTAVVSSETNDCQFNGCIFDNNTGQAVTSIDDLGLSFTDCYIGGSNAAASLVSVSIVSANVNQACKFNACVFIQYAACSAVMFQLTGVSGTYYNNAVISGCEFRDANNVPSILSANYVANSVMTNCIINGTPTGQPVVIANAAVATPGFRVHNVAGLTPYGTLNGTGPYPAPTALATVGNNNYYQNPYPFDCMVYISGGTIAGVVVNINGRAVNLGVPGSVIVPAGAELFVGFTGTPTWFWFGI